MKTYNLQKIINISFFLLIISFSNGQISNSPSNGTVTPSHCNFFKGPAVGDGSFNSLSPLFTKVEDETIIETSEISDITNLDTFINIKAYGDVNFYNKPNNTTKIGSHPSSGINGGVFASLGSCPSSNSPVNKLVINVDIRAGEQYVVKFKQAYGHGIKGEYSASEAVDEPELLKRFFTSHFLVSLSNEHQNAPNITFTGKGSQTWEDVELVFTARATSNNAELQFKSVFENDYNSCHYLSIDDIRFFKKDSSCDLEDPVPPVESKPCSILKEEVDGSFESLKYLFNTELEAEVLSEGLVSNPENLANFMYTGYVHVYYNTTTATPIVRNHPPSSASSPVFLGLYGYAPFFSGGESGTFDKDKIYTTIDIKEGETYSVKFKNAYGAEDFIEASGEDFISRFIVTLNGVSKNAPNLKFSGYGTQTWSDVELLFTATETKNNALLEFEVASGIPERPGSYNLIHYLTIDDIRVSTKKLRCDLEDSVPPTDALSCSLLKEEIDGSFNSLSPLFTEESERENGSNGFVSGPGILSNTANFANFNSVGETYFFYNTTDSTPVVGAHPPSREDGSVFIGLNSCHAYPYRYGELSTGIDIIEGETYVVKFKNAYAYSQPISLGIIPRPEDPDTSHIVVTLNGVSQHAPDVSFTGLGTQTWCDAELVFTATETKLDAVLDFSVHDDEDGVCHTISIDDIRVFVKGSICDLNDPVPPSIKSVPACEELPYDIISDLPIPNNGNTVVWYESEVVDSLFIGLPGFVEYPYESDEEIIYGETYWAEVDGNPERIPFEVPVPQNILGDDEEEGYQIFPEALNATVANLEITIPEHMINSGVTISDVTWHDAVGSPLPLTPETKLETKNYYAAVNGASCRFKVEVEIKTRDILTPVNQTFCSIENPTVANLEIYDNYGLEIRWYDAASGGLVLENSVPLENNTSYYGVLFDGINESEERVNVHVNILDTPAPALITEELIVFIEKNETATVKDIIIPGTENLEWYLSQNSTDPLSQDTVIEDGVTYYATQVLTGERCVSSNRLEAKVKIEVIPPPKLILCEKFRPELGEKYVFSGWVRQLGLQEKSSQRIKLNDDTEAKNLLLDLMNHFVQDFAFSTSGNPLDKFVPPVYVPSPGTRKYDLLRKYIPNPSTDTFTIYNFKYLTDEDTDYTIVENNTDINNTTTRRRVRRTIGFQFSFKPSDDPDYYDVKYLTPIYDNEENRRYPLFNNPTLNLEFDDVVVSQLNRSTFEMLIHGNFSIDKGDTNYINSNTKTSTFRVRGFFRSYDLKSYEPDPNYQVESYSKSLVEILFEDEEGNELEKNAKLTINTSGQVIDGWQRITASFIVPIDAGYMTILLKNTEPSNSINSYFDDIRVHPYDSNLKTFVYNPYNQRLTAELDENNYATYYEYDKEGGLVRVKKETTRGVYTIQETRSSSRINTQRQ